MGIIIANGTDTRSNPVYSRIPNILSATSPALSPKAIAITTLIHPLVLFQPINDKQRNIAANKSIVRLLAPSHSPVIVLMFGYKVLHRKSLKGKNAVTKPAHNI